MFSDCCMISDSHDPSFFVLLQKQSLRTLWEHIDEVDKWKQIEELEFILMRMQVVVLACQVENVPTFSSIPIWIKHLMKILNVYQEDNELVAQYKHLTSQVVLFSVSLFCSWSVFICMSGLCVPSQSLKERFEWILFDEHMWLAVVLDPRCSMATKESWFHDFALNFARPAASASSSTSSASSSVLPLGIRFTTLASFFLHFVTHHDAPRTLLEDIAVSSSVQSSSTSSSTGVSASSSVSTSAPFALGKRRGLLLGMIALFMCLPSCIIIHLGDF